MIPRFSVLLSCKINLSAQAMKNIAIFASGSGTNAERISQYFKDKSQVSIKLILTNNTKAGVLDRAAKLGIPSLVFSRSDFYESEAVMNRLQAEKIDWIILAGFLWLVPSNLLRAYPNRVVNIHPALLPNYGGKGMYGMRVHEAVVASGDKESGITIHYVNENYDEGQVIFQAKVGIDASDQPQDLAAKIHELEYANFPVVIEKLLNEE